MRRFLWAILVLCWLPFGSFAADEKFAIERRSVTVEGRTLNYRSTAGILVVGEQPQARVFFTAYELDGPQGSETEQRPLAFAFNGGPGAASAYLHVGAMGPRRVQFNDDGSIPAPPQRLVDNELSWLAFTDMVFVDPVGTGFSRVQKGEGKDGDKDSDFWGVYDDANAQARFIRQYLTRSNRWPSPKYLVGESYGGFRVALLSEMLPSNYGIGLSGVVLISPALQFAVTRPDAFDVLPWALRLPALAAVAAHHGKSSIAKPADGLDRNALAGVEAWSLDTYLPGLARGGSLTGAPRQAMFDKLAEFTGMPKEVVRRRNGKVGSGEFVKQVLRDTGRLPSLYDGALIALDPDPESPTPQRGDLGLDQITAALLSPFNAYVRDELKYETDLPYLMLNGEVNSQWRWRGGRGQGFAGWADSLRNAMTLNPKLKVLVAHGLFDLVTPYFASVYILDQLQLEAPIKDNLTYRAYAAGHMIYTHAAARAALYKDAKAVFEGAAKP